MKLALALKKSKMVFLTVLFLLMPAFCLAYDQILISEVLYDPLITETGGEAVELYNPSESDIDASGYILRTESSLSDATLPAGTIIESHHFYLIADSGWSASKDNVTWPDADHEEAITMSNTNAGVAIIHPNGTVIDAVGWGSAQDINTGLFEGTPSAEVSAGKSLRRINLEQDSNNNSFDFSESIPELKNHLATEQEQEEATGELITLDVSVLNNPPKVVSVAVLDDEDDTKEGVQVIPVPDNVKMINISAEVDDSDGISDIETVNLKIKGPDSEKNVEMTLFETFNSTRAVYTASIDLLFYDAPGVYNVTITSNDSSNSGLAYSSFEYLSMAAISIDSGSLHFKGAKLGDSTEIRGDFALSTIEAPTIKNTGNTFLDIGLYGTDMVSGANSISTENIKYSFDNDFESEVSGILRKTLQTTALNLQNGDNIVTSLGFSLFVPSTTKNGNYTGNVTVVAISG